MVVMSDEMNVLDLFHEIKLAKSRMSLNNPHRETFAKCEAALWHLSKQLHDLKKNAPVSPPLVAEGTPV